jgi:tetratricopeptide (TPR) repeat protein
VLQLQLESQKEKELSEILTESAKAKKEYSENSLNELIKQWLLLARTYDMKNDYEKTMIYYEKIINADTTNAENMFEFANYLKKISKFSKAEEYFLRCLEIYNLLEKENTGTYLSDRVEILRSLGNLHVSINEPDKALLEFEEALQIYRKLIAEDTNTDIFQLAIILNSLGIYYYYSNNFPAALLKYEEALKIYREFTTKNPEKSLSEKQLLDMSGTLNNIGNVYLHTNNKNADYSKAKQYLMETVQIRKKLADENPKYLPDLALSLINLGIVYYRNREFSKALPEYTEALKIYRELAAENPRRYLPYVAAVLSTLGSLHNSTREFSISMAKHTEALAIRKELASENPKVYLPDVARSLFNIGVGYSNNDEHSKSIHPYKESANIYRELVAKNPKIYLPEMITILYYLSVSCIYAKEYVNSEQYCCEILELDSTYIAAKIMLAHTLLLQNRFSEAEAMYKELSKIIYQNNKFHTKTILNNFDDFEKANLFSEEQKNNVEKIRRMMKE